jgi:phage terminase large subunit-like protein
VSTLVVPPLDDRPWPTLGPQLVQFLEERAVFGPGSLKGQPAVVDAEKAAIIYRAYELYPRGHEFAGRRRFRRVAVSLRKGTAKTELAAWVAYLELHPESPVRCDGFDRWGRPVGRPVRDPYIPMLAYTEEQVEELAYGALYTMVTEGPDADLFDAGLDRIIRLDARGRADGRAVALANSPSARDGARTTHQNFDETHRMHLPRQVDSYETMMANLDKRPLDDPWSLEQTTAGQLGQGSVAENTHLEAEAIARGEIRDPQLFYLHRSASPGHDMSTVEGRVAAVREATGPVGEFGPGQFLGIAKQWDRPRADKKYLERVWLNRWETGDAQAFDLARWEKPYDRGGLARAGAEIPRGALVAAGFDGARFRDSTAIVLTDIRTGLQQMWACWERPLTLHADAEWEVPEDEVTDAWAEIRRKFRLWKAYCDPPHWTETVGAWEARYPDQFEEWWTNRRRPMAEAIRAYSEAMAARQVTHTDDPVLNRHIGNAGKDLINLWDDDGRQLYILTKLHPTRKFDAAMAGCLSWRARLDALKKGALQQRESYVPKRLR